MSAPATEPITLQEAKSHLRLTQAADDSELSTVWIPAARAYAEQRLGRSAITQTWKVTLDRFPMVDGESISPPSMPIFPAESFLIGSGYSSGVISVPLNPVQSVTSIKYYDLTNTQQTLSPTLYQLDKARSPARLLPTAFNFWPMTYPRLAAVEVVVITGDGSNLAVNPLVRSAILCQIRHLYDGLDGVSKTADSLLDLAWDGTRHG